MLVLLAIGFVAGIVTALSPCVLPVLPIVLAGGATGRRPLAIIAGIVVSFTVFTLFAAWLLDQIGLPDDFLRNLAIALLFLVSLTLLVPAGRRARRPAASAPDPSALGRPRRRLPARREPRPRVRSVRRAHSRRDHDDRGDARDRNPGNRAHARLRRRRRPADAGDRVRGPGRGGTASLARAGASHRQRGSHRRGCLRNGAGARPGSAAEGAELRRGGSGAARRLCRRRARGADGSARARGGRRERRRARSRTTARRRSSPASSAGSTRSRCHWPSSAAGSS